MKRFIMSAAALGLASVSFAQSTEKPNFVLFIADDCSHYDLGCYGSPDSKTPNIDRFATQGVRFTQCYQAVPMSSPTRHNLYTGLWPVHSGAYPNHTIADEGTKSVVHHLGAQGYRVALIGKSHVEPESVFPFDPYVPSIKGNDINFEAVEQFIKECKASGTPFCLFVASHQPHTPWNKGDASQFDADKLTLPPMYVDMPETRTQLTHYLAEINYMDNEFGKVLDIMDKADVTDNTATVYLSEQGNSFPFAKWTCYDAGVHSACIVRWPGVVKPGTVSDAMVEYVDIVPTFIDIAGGKPVAPVDGKSFKPVLTGKKKDHKQYTYSMQTTRGIFHGSDYYGIRSVADKEYRYIVNLTPEMEFRNAMTHLPIYDKWRKKVANDPKMKPIFDKYQHRPAIELYNTKEDPYCLNNLADDPKYASVIKRMDGKLKAWMKSCGDEGQPTEMRALEHQARNKK